VYDARALYLRIQRNSELIEERTKQVFYIFPWNVLLGHTTAKKSPISAINRATPLSGHKPRRTLSSEGSYS